MKGFVIKHGNKYERNDSCEITWTLDIKKAYVWHYLELAQSQASDYKLLGFSTEIVDLSKID
jgi:hypothetical protein